MNGDGRPDVVFLLTQEPGGSGTFFYVVAALRNEAGYQGTNGILLGDRIAPQNIAIENGRIVVNYADRKPDEPMTTRPSVGVSRFFKVLEGKLVADEAVSQITNRKWVWEQTQMNDGTVTTPKQPDAFTITFLDNGQVQGTTDCNSFSGTYKVNGPSIEFGPFASTMMACEGSQEAEFMKSLGEVDQFLYVEKEDKLALMIKYNSGSMVFK